MRGVVNVGDDEPAEHECAGGGGGEHAAGHGVVGDEALGEYSDYWEAVRRYYAPFEEGMLAPTASVYQHEMPGGQYTNLRVQSKSLGLEGRWNEVASMYTQVNQLFGDIVKVTPSSKIVGDMAIFMVTNNLKPAEVLEPERHLAFPKSVVEYFRGDIGHPVGGFPKPLQKIILGKEKPLKGRPGASLPKINMEKTGAELEEKIHHEPTETELASYLMYPQVFLEYERFRKFYGDVSVIPTTIFFYGLQPYQEVPIEIEPGKVLLVKFLTVGDADADGNVTVFFELNGQPREVKVPDRKRTVTKVERSKGGCGESEACRGADAGEGDGGDGVAGADGGEGRCCWRSRR